MAKTYYGYAQREAAEGVDWSGVARKFTNMLEMEQEAREQDQAALDKANTDLATTLQTAPNGETQELHNYMLDYANNASNYQLMLKRSVDNGNMSKKQYTNAINNLMAGTNQAISLVTKYNDFAAKQQEKINNDTMAGQKLYENQLLETMLDFSNTALYIDPVTFKVSQGKTVETTVGTGNDAKKVRTMSTNTGDFRPVATMTRWMGEDYNKFDMSAAVTKIAGNMATTYEQIVNKSGVGEEDNVRLNESYDKALDAYISSYLENPKNVTSILADYAGVAKNDLPFDFTTDETEKNKENLIYIQPNKRGGYDLDLDSKHGKKLRAAAAEVLKGAVDVKLPRKVTAQPVQETGKFDKDYANMLKDFSMDARSAANWMTLQNADNLEEWTSAKNFWLGKQIKSGNDFVTIADIRINDNNDGVELVINQKEGGQKTIPASFGNNQAWLNQGAGGVLQGIDVSGIANNPQFAQNFMTGDRKIGEDNTFVNWSTQGTSIQGINYENLDVPTSNAGTADEVLGSPLDLINQTEADSSDEVITIVNTIFNSLPANNRQMLSDQSLSPVEHKDTEYAEVYFPQFMTAPIYINAEEGNANKLNAIIKKLYDSAGKQEMLRPNDFKTVLGDDFAEQESIMTNRIVKGDIPKSGRNENPVSWNGGDGRLLVTNRIQKENELVAKDIDIAGYVIGERPDILKIKKANPELTKEQILDLWVKADEHFRLYSK
jgi:hypothetical protein